MASCEGCLLCEEQRDCNVPTHERCEECFHCLGNHRDDDPQNIHAFIRDLIALSQKHDLWISGCGECGSPWIERKSGEDGREGPGYVLTPTDEHDGYQYYPSRQAASEREPHVVIRLGESNAE